MYDLYKEIKKIARTLEDNHLPYALCGGLAVGIYSEPRATIDIDLVVEPSQLEKIIEVLSKVGFEKFSAPMPLDKGKMNIQRLVKLEKGEPEVLILDLCMPDKNEYPQVWKDWNRSLVEEMEIWVISRQGLIAMKRSRSSEKDLADIILLEKF